MKLFLDTNVLLDVLGRREPYAAGASVVWSRVERGTHDGHISAISFNNVYYIVRKARSTPVARKTLVLLRDIFSGVAPDQQILNQAIDSDIDDFEDAIQFYSAVHAGTDYLVTRNAGDFPAGTLPVLMPDDRGEGHCSRFP